MRIVVWCLACKLPHPHRFYTRCPYCGSGRKEERPEGMGGP